MIGLSIEREPMKSRCSCSVHPWQHSNGRLCSMVGPVLMSQLPSTRMRLGQLKIADSRLYEAKNEGRNQTVFE